MKGCLLNYFRAMILVTSLFDTGNSAMVWLPTAGSIIWWNAKSFARPPLTRTESSHFVGHQIHVVSSNSFRLKREIQKILVDEVDSNCHWVIGSLGVPLEVPESFWTATSSDISSDLQAEPTAFPSLQPLGSGGMGSPDSS